MKVPECWECAALPYETVTLGGTWPVGYAGPWRPKVPRPIVSGVRKPRCRTHERARKAAQKARSHETTVRRIFGVPEGWYAAQYERQGRKCALPRCRATGKSKRLAVDHDRELAVLVTERHPVAHAADRACRYCVRGLVCGPHNYDLLGRFRVDLQDALDYLAAPPAQAWHWDPEGETA